MTESKKIVNIYVDDGSSDNDVRKSIISSITRSFTLSDRLNSLISEEDIKAFRKGDPIDFKYHLEISMMFYPIRILELQDDS